MGGTSSNNGITLKFYDEHGNEDTTRSAIHYEHSWLTAQPQGAPGVGSGDWLREVYLAPDPKGLYSLLKTKPPEGRFIPLTSASSLDVQLHYLDSSGQMQSEPWKTVIGEGQDTTVTLPASSAQEGLRLFDVLMVTQADVSKDPTNKLAAAFQAGIPHALPLHPNGAAARPNTTGDPLLGGPAGQNGITLQFYDESGSFTTRAPLHQPCCWLTGQPAGTPGVGSQDWLKEVFLAPDQEDLYALMRAYPPAGTVVPLNAAASQNVRVNYVDSDATVRSSVWKTAIGIGSDVHISTANGQSERLHLIDTLLLCNGDAYNDPNHGLHQLFADCATAASASRHSAGTGS